MVNEYLQVTSFTSTSIIVQKPLWFSLLESGKFKLLGEYGEIRPIVEYESVIDHGTELELQLPVNSLPYVTSEVSSVPAATEVIFYSKKDYMDVVLPYKHNLKTGSLVSISDFAFPASNTVIPDFSGGLALGDVNTQSEVLEVFNDKRLRLKLPVKYGEVKAFIQSFNCFSDYQGYSNDCEAVFANEDDRVDSYIKKGAKLYYKAQELSTVVDMQATIYYSKAVFEVRRIEGETLLIRSDEKPIKTSTVFEDSYIYMDGISIKDSGMKITTDETQELYSDLSILLYTNTVSVRKPSYVYDPSGNYQAYVCSNISTSLVSTATSYFHPVYKNNSYRFLATNGCEDFPSEGNIVINHGKGHVEGPISYYSHDGVNIFIDQKHIFENTHYKNSEIRLLRSDEPIVLSSSADEYQSYVTDVLSVKTLLQNTLTNVSTAGTVTTIKVRYPELKYQEESINPFISPKENN